MSMAGSPATFTPVAAWVARAGEFLHRATDDDAVDWSAEDRMRFAVLAQATATLAVVDALLELAREVMGVAEAVQGELG